MFTSRSGLRYLAWIAMPASLLALMLSCGGGGGGGEPAAPPTGSSNTPADMSAATPKPVVATAASVSVKLEVPAALAVAPFDSARNLVVPPGFGIRLWARVPGARFMAVAPNGDILVSNPGAGRITLLRERPNDVPQSFIFASGLTQPHDMVFHQIGATMYLYVAESNRITRSIYASGATQSATMQVVVDGLPDASTPELRGSYFHELKNIALSPDHKLYVSIASSCNVCLEDTVSDPLRGAIYQYNADGGSRRLFARGLRNAEGVRFIPDTGALWVTVNNRDEIAYPFNNDFDGDGSIDLGKVLPAYVDDNPPDLFTQVRDGGHYGWPFCNGIPNAAMSNLEFAADVQMNLNSFTFNCANADRASKGIRAHSAPLGMNFLHNTAAPAAYRRGAVVALHGCWNCTSLRAGYKVVYFPFDANGVAGAEIDLVTGFVINPDDRTLWGRPVDVIADAAGRLLISDDYAGAVYQLYPIP